MALPPSVFIPVARGLKKNNYSTAGINRIVIEKPFGKDLDSSREMMRDLKAEWTEEETFRIDHYLGKEMVKNLLVLRFGNMFLESSFNKNYISNVQITFKEAIGTEGRGGYFDEFGILRDVCQNRQCLFSLVLRRERTVGSSCLVPSRADPHFFCSVIQIFSRLSPSSLWSDPFRSLPRTSETRRYVSPPLTSLPSSEYLLRFRPEIHPQC
jgi:hypothetical protein